MGVGAVKAFEPLVVSADSTVVAEYEAPESSVVEYQSEAQLENEFIRILQSQAYEYFQPRSEEELVANLRRQLEKLNKTEFSDSEWKRFFDGVIASKNDGIKEKTKRIQQDHVQLMELDDGRVKNIRLIDKANIHNNSLQVINQYETVGSSRSNQGEPLGEKRLNRYDVTVLVNGFPMVHIELKRRGVDIREAFNQIQRYQRESFWSGSGLFEYVQLFVISNGTLTKYYSNTTRVHHIETTAKKSSRKTSNSYEFTSWWADGNNKPIQELTDFARTFFAKHTLLNILTRYCVLTVDDLLLVMRPYQIVATERILSKIQISTNYKTLGTLDAGGYIWHTTGSGKTLTSFKASILASQMESVDKVLFVVDRKDLDYQTMREYERFQKGAADSNTSTAVLKRQLEDSDSRIIITTIQKLSTFVKANKKHPVFAKHVVMIFDECHRSQFGEMHTEITKSFKKYNLFGFTGTPIFAVNSSSGGNPYLKTTQQAFGDKLHTYTIVDAITDRNVLPFRIDYIDTIKVGDVRDKDVSAVDTERALLAPQRISEIVAYTLEHFPQKTKRWQSYEHTVVSNVVESTRNRRAHIAKNDRRHVRGFNALFATASIDAAKRYYNEFQAQQDGLTPDERLKIGMIFSYGANEATADGIIEDESFEPENLDNSSRDFLEDVINDYNDMFNTSYDTSADKFQNYYKDLSQRLKNRELDLVIVVNMFLTGFDATTLNTLFVDKNLKAHGLIQAYSRTNRILNSVKTYGNIVCFRDLEEETNKALELFGNKDAHGVVILKPFRDYYAEYANKTSELLQAFPEGERIIGESRQKEFIALFGAILRLQNILSSFDEFTGQEILTPRQEQNYRSIYLDIYAHVRGEQDADKEVINDDLVFEIELIKQVEINVDYILLLVEKYREQHGDGQDKDIRAEISRSLSASPTLRSKRDLIEAFVDSISPNSDVEEEWVEFIRYHRGAELQGIVEEEKLQPISTREFIIRCFADGSFKDTGTDIAELLPRVSRFKPDPEGLTYAERKRRVTEKLSEYYDRFEGLGYEADAVLNGAESISVGDIRDI
ncbi:type I restriction endonuclease subunit R [Corynebacterium sp. ES2794-CONJ1]|uniref:type I restriction endonuclease subunit R n=1 Tax=Corynebacterium sp. ES2794-CONJ1 TaxID=2980553 RepID=UPI0021D83B29|nr:type I restriction endonuclease subunit R [Corynebacterium sp. ES2794-CONJ1]MCU9519736.1 type I restriction endonuclease subunit R [Corynebacterium sp. ES2794-CONJ1]